MIVCLLGFCTAVYYIYTDRRCVFGVLRFIPCSQKLLLYGKVCNFQGGRCHIENFVILNIQHSLRNSNMLSMCIIII